MGNQFYKGRTNNHLTWVMVDATDFATPESAVSAATTIKIYGKLRGQAAANFVSSGAGSLTNDIQHVGASATGIYTIALAKADLSDASAAWYDQYIITLSATGCARQTLVVDGGIDASAVSAYQSRLSDLASALLVTQSMASDAASAAVQANSRVLLVLSNVSDVQSKLSDVESNLISLIGTTGVQLNASMLSDLRSAIAAGPAATVTASDISDIASAVKVALASLVTTTGVNLNASVYSDLRSAISAGPAATVTASDISDIASAVKAILASDLSDLYSLLSNVNSIAGASPTASDIASKVWADTTGAAVSSRVLLNLSRISDLQSKISDVESNLLSLLTTTGVQINASSLSDLRSAISAGPGATVTASDISDIASAVRATLISDLSDIHSAATAAASRALLNQSRISDVQSALLVETSRLSDIYSLLSDLHSDVGVMSGVLSDTYSLVTARTPTAIAAAVLSAATADPIDANIEQINTVTVNGNGAGTPWGP